MLSMCARMAARSAARSSCMFVADVVAAKNAMVRTDERRGFNVIDNLRGMICAGWKNNEGELYMRPCIRHPQITQIPQIQKDKSSRQAEARSFLLFNLHNLRNLRTP